MATNQERTQLVTTSNLQSDGNVTNNNNQDIGWRQKFLFISKIVYPLACTAYNFYLVWLLAYLKDNRNYWYLSFVAFMPLVSFIDQTDIPAIVTRRSFERSASVASALVTLHLMVCFTMLSRLAYYHVQPDKFIGPRFVIVSLQGSIILFTFGFLLRRDFKVNFLLKEKDILTGVVLDFVDIFNLVDVLSANECVGVNRVGMFLSEGSSTEMAIQAFCSISFIILQLVFTYGLHGRGEGDNWTHDASIALTERIVPLASIVYQNFPFLVIRIIIWARYRLYSLGFLMKNVVAIVVCSMQVYKFCRQGGSQ